MMTSSRVVVLPRQGTLLVSADLHGNGDDLRALVDRFHRERELNPATCWVLLGDAVHGPDEDARRREPRLYDFSDESWPIVEELSRLREQHPASLFYVLGNHDFSHIGGPRTAKFYPDEAAHLESTLSADERERLRAFFRGSCLAVAAPCGVLLTHGSPDDRLDSIEALDRIELSPSPQQADDWALLTSVLTSYGQPADVTDRLLATVRRTVPGVRLVIHGHDRDEAGYFVEGGNQACPVLFGAPREAKRIVKLDLAATYRGVEDLREGCEILRLYPES